MSTKNNKYGYGESEVIKLEQWCSKHYNDNEIASRFLDSLSDILISSKVCLDPFEVITE